MTEHNKEEHNRYNNERDIDKKHSNHNMHSSDHNKNEKGHEYHSKTEHIEAGHDTELKSKIHESLVGHHGHKTAGMITKPIIALMALAVLLLIFNQVQINSITDSISGLSTVSSVGHTSLLGGKDLTTLDTDELKSTAHTVAAVFELEGKDGDEVMAEMFPTGTPDYGEALGVSYDDPVGSLQTLAKTYRGLKAEVEKNDPAAFQRFINLAAKPKGVSCEYCCGVGPIGIDDKGNSRCGCSHNPGVLTVALYLSAYTDYSDGEILREVMRWKTLWFPKNMIGIGAQLAGGDTSALDDLPGMVGGC